MKILIADDKEEDLYMLETLLKNSGYDVVSTKNGREALEKLKKESFNLIISDILMPVMDGFQLCRECQQDEKLMNIPFVFYTATYTDEKDKELALKVGADSYIRKPLDPVEFIKIIKGIIKEVAEGKIKQKSKVLEEKETFKLYSVRLVKKLEKKMLELKKEISERKRVEEELLHAQKMEALGILAGGIAHDFNNLLTIIQGYINLAMIEVDKETPLYRDLKQVHLAAIRASTLTRRLLLFSRKQPISFTPLNINETINGMIKMLKRLIPEDISINTNLASVLWTVQADAGSIEQIIMNFAVNVRDAMPKGGQLIISTRNIEITEEDCKTIPESRPGKFVCLSVKDTGIGMDKQTIQHIFEPFFTTKQTGEGTGLGLSVVYGIAKQHQGWVNVHSKSGYGSIFEVYFPAVPIKAESKTEEEIPLQEIQGRGERILLVEDEKLIRELVTKVLIAYGYVIFESATGEEAMDIFEREKGQFDLIFSDVVLSDKNGIQLVNEFLSINPELRVLLSSGYAGRKLQWSTIYKKGFKFLQKPYDITELLQSVKKALGEG